MKKFSFRLESYLQICHHREQLELLRLNELMNEERNIREALEDLHSSLVKVSADLSAQREIRAFEISWYRQRMQFISLQIEQTGNQLDAVLGRVAAQRNLLVEARKKRRIVEKLREKRYERFQFELDRTIQNEMEDLFLLGREGRPFLSD